MRIGRHVRAKKLVATLVVLAVVGCSRPPTQTPGADGGATAGRVGPVAGDSTIPPADQRPLTAGDTLDLRVAGAIGLGSPEARAAGCSTRPPVSEELIIADTAFYSVFRVVEGGCGSVGVDTQQLEGTYRLFRDTIQFYRGGGKEVELGYRGVVSADTLRVFSGTPLGTLTFTRRPRPAN